MPEPKRLVIPREATPMPGRSLTTHGSKYLPPDLVTEQVARLALFSLVAMGAWTTGLVMDRIISVATPTLVQYDVWKHQVLEVIGISISALMFIYVRHGRHTSETKVDVSLVYMILNAGIIAAMNTWLAPPPLKAQMLQVSWISILLLVYSMVAPVSPGKMLGAAIVAASLDPLGVWLAHLRGVTTPSAGQTVILFWPNYLCALLSTIPSRFLRTFGHKLRKARELGSYELVRLLGHGGMGEVWEAQHRLLARRAAVKLVRPEVLGAGSDAEARIVVKRFEREAQATAALNSPHTIQVFDFGSTDEGSFYYVMELLMGRDLESLVRNFGPVPARGLLPVAASLPFVG